MDVIQPIAATTLVLQIQQANPVTRDICIHGRFSFVGSMAVINVFSAEVNLYKAFTMVPNSRIRTWQVSAISSAIQIISIILILNQSIQCSVKKYVNLFCESE